MGSIETPSPRHIPTLLGNIASNGNALSQGDTNARTDLLIAARELCLALESPVEAVLRIAWAEPSNNSAIRVAIDLGVFEKLMQDEGSPKSSSQLGTAVGADPQLLGRILRHLAAMGIIHETDADEYTSTTLSEALATKTHFSDGIPFVIDCAWPPMAAMGPYLAKTGYKMPQSGKDCPFQYGHHTPLTYFEWLNANPLCGKRFMSHMAGFRRGQTSWVKPDFYPVEERLVKGMNKDKDAVLLVDVGGAEGFDIEEFRSQHPQAPGRYIVQDQSEILNRITKTPTFEPMVHDFFTPQPIIGARAYFMRMILHDWSDEKAREILSNLKSAMTPGYSKILINEMVIPDKGAHWVSTALDMFMMTLLASRERTETQWRELVATVGLKATGIWTKEAGAVSLIECEVA